MGLHNATGNAEHITAATEFGTQLSNQCSISYEQPRPWGLPLQVRIMPDCAVGLQANTHMRATRVAQARLTAWGAGPCDVRRWTRGRTSTRATTSRPRPTAKSSEASCWAPRGAAAAHPPVMRIAPRRGAAPPHTAPCALVLACARSRARHVRSLGGRHALQYELGWRSVLVDVTATGASRAVHAQAGDFLKSALRCGAGRHVAGRAPPSPSRRRHACRARLGERRTLPWASPLLSPIVSHTQVHALPGWAQPPGRAQPRLGGALHLGALRAGARPGALCAATRASSGSASAGRGVGRAD